MKAKTPRAKLEPFRVYIGQVNQTYIEVRAIDMEAARDKAYRKWRKDEAHSSITAIEAL